MNSTYISSDQLHAVKKLANKNTFESIVLKFCEISKQDSTYELLIEDESIVEVFDISDYTLENLNKAINSYKHPSNAEQLADDLDWEFSEQTEGVLTFETPMSIGTVRVSPDSRYEEWSISYADSIPNGYNITYPSYASAVAALFFYMVQHNPAQIEYTKLLHEQAAEVYAEYDEIPNKTAAKLLNNNIYSFEAILENKYLLSENKQEIIQLAEELQNTQSEPKNSEIVTEYLTNVTVNNL